jgi:hypothetical protein
MNEGELELRDEEEVMYMKRGKISELHIIFRNLKRAHNWGEGGRLLFDETRHISSS